MKSHIPFVIALVGTMSLIAACGADDAAEDTGSIADSDTDSDADTNSDTDSNADSDSDPDTDTESDTVEAPDTDSAYEMDSDTDEVNRLALLMGISDYVGTFDDLNGSPHGDVRVWYNYLEDRGYEINVLGDGNPDSYPVYHDIATKANMHVYIKHLLSSADANDIVVIAHTGHGLGDSFGRAQILTQEGGTYSDEEFCVALEENPNVGQVFVFLVTCHSGGFGPEIMATTNAANTWFSSTCTAGGLGYAGVAFSMWTSYFLLDGLQHHFKGERTSMEEAFAYAAPTYITKSIEINSVFDPIADQPMEFDGNIKIPFYIDPTPEYAANWFEIIKGRPHAEIPALGVRLDRAVSARVITSSWSTDGIRTHTSNTIRKTSILSEMNDLTNPDQAISEISPTCLFSHQVDYYDRNGKLFGRIGLCRLPNFRSNHPAVWVDLDDDGKTLSRGGIVVPNPNRFAALFKS